MWILLAALLTLPARQPSPALESTLRGIIARSGAEVAIAYRTLDGKDELLIDPDKPFHAASTMKVPVMIELYRQAAAGRLSLDEALPIRNEFHSIVDGSPYKLGEDAAADKDVVAAIGSTLTLRRLSEAMITLSSNFAANVLIERLGGESIRRTVTSLGADGMHVLRGVEDLKAFEKGLNNSTTARALMVLFDRLAKGTAVGPTADAEMIEVLKRQQVNDSIPAGLPPGTPVAHKTGDITRIRHDAGVVYGPRPYVLVVLTRGIEDQKLAAALIAAVSKAVNDASVSRERQSPHRSRGAGGTETGESSLSPVLDLHRRRDQKTRTKFTTGKT